MTVVQNNECLKLGLSAASNWQRAANADGTGDAIAIKALYDAQRMLSFEATIVRGKDRADETIVFDVVDLATPLFSTDGSKDTKAMSARTNALALRMFSIEVLDNRMKQRIRRAVEAFVYLIERGKTVSDDMYHSAVTLSGQNKLIVEYDAVHAAPALDADDNAKAVFEAMKGKPCTLTGKNGASLAELSKRASPHKDKRAAGDSKDTGASFEASIKFVRSIVLSWDGFDGETDIAPSKSLEKELYDLQIALAAHFTANPIEGLVSKSKAA